MILPGRSPRGPANCRTIGSAVEAVRIWGIDVAGAQTLATQCFPDVSIRSIGGSKLSFSDSIHEAEMSEIARNQRDAQP